jgi:hypothetical protein
MQPFRVNLDTIPSLGISICRIYLSHVSGGEGIGQKLEASASPGSSHRHPTNG